MVRKKVDERIRVLIENGAVTRHRSMFFVVGEKSRDQVVILYHMLPKTFVKQKGKREVLWLYKKDLGFSSHRNKRMKQRKRKEHMGGQLDVKEDDPFDVFLASTNIRYCYYNETQKILGNTYHMCVLQDFEALTPNLLARSMETVEGGGLIVVLLRNVSSMKQLYTMAMDVHSRYRTESHQDVIGRFNERFILSLASCKTCLCIDDKLNVLPISNSMLRIERVPPKSMDDPLLPSEENLRKLKEQFEDQPAIKAAVGLCKTVDQGKAVLKFIDAIVDKSQTLQSTVVLTAARGRGKSAALGISMACAVAFNYSNIFVTSPSPENLKTLFEFVFKTFEALNYQEHTDYSLVQSTNPEFNKAIIRVNVFRDHRQTIQYIHPSDSHKLGQAELVCIDEAAAIPLPLVKNLLGRHLVFMSSTINGYEGTGRSLSLKLISQLREQSATYSGQNIEAKASQGVERRALHEIKLNESIRYNDGDPVESWLNHLLCLDATNVPRITSGCPVPTDCQLYYVNRDTLFSYHKAPEAFLQRLMALYVSSHYKNSPNDLQMLSDAPAHHIFCLLGPIDPQADRLPQILCVLQVCLEGEISKQSALNGLSRGKGASGDLVPWTLSKQFNDTDFPSLSGARVYRIATHPDYQRMGYGKRALQLLQDYYEGRIISLSEDATEVEQEAAVVADEDVTLQTEEIKPKKKLPPLLLELKERHPEKLDYLSVSFGLTQDLLRFWKCGGFVPVYLRQTPNDLTGEHSCIMLKCLSNSSSNDSDDESDADEDSEDKTSDNTWLSAYLKKFQRRFISLLPKPFNTFTSSMALTVLQQKGLERATSPLTKAELDIYLDADDITCLENYSLNLADYWLITDLLPRIAELYFRKKIVVQLSAHQKVILLGLGLQRKSVDDLEEELHLPAAQVLAWFLKTIKAVVKFLQSVQEAAIEQQLVEQKEIHMEPVAQSLEDDLAEAAREVNEERQRSLSLLADGELSQYAIGGSDEAWSEALKRDKSTSIISVKGSNLLKKRKAESEEKTKKQQKTHKHKKHKPNKGGHGHKK